MPKTTFSFCMNYILDQIILTIKFLAILFYLKLNKKLKSFFKKIK